MAQMDRQQTKFPDLLQEICGAENLPSLPAVALRVLQMTQADDVSVNELAEVVGQDPALTARILKLVNSPLFGVARRIVSVQQAMVVLGLRTVKVLALSFSIVDSYGQKRVEWFNYKTYWRRSLTQAVAARLIAEAAAPTIRDEAFVAGLISNLGILAMAQVARQRYAEPYNRAAGNHGALLHEEKACLGFTHPEAGKVLFEHWNLPPDVCQAVELHHIGCQGSVDSRVARLIDTVFVASCVADLFCDGATQQSLDDLHKMAAQRLKIARTALDRVLDTLQQHVKQSAMLMSVDIGQTISYEELRNQAVLQLARLSVSSGVDLAAARQREVVSRKREKELEKAAATDSLSGLANRAAFDRHMDHTVRQSIAAGKPVGLIMCDLDLFKKINDTYGHPIGDLVIAATGDILAGYHAKDVFAARYGGEEFAVVISNCTYPRLVKTAQEICEKFRGGSVICSQGTIRFNASIGAASTQSLSEPSPAALIALADKFLYLAKKRGRARACVAAPPGKANVKV